jgi:hypothetical protein
MYLYILIALLLFGIFGGNNSTLDRQINPIIKPYIFDLGSWELSAVSHEIATRTATTGDGAVVVEYFELGQQADDLEFKLEWVPEYADNSSLKTELDRISLRQNEIEQEVERTLEHQIRDTLEAQGIYSPWSRLRVSFPPVNFKLTEPPFILVISPRDRIESIDEVMVRPDISLNEIGEIESRIDSLGESALVTPIGGLSAAYPAFVANNMGLWDTINAATEEWFHQYLAFRPLGFRYVLDVTGISPNYDIAMMNETLAGIVSREIGGLVYDKYYRQYFPVENDDPNNTGANADTPAFDFNATMREIRTQVDLYLSQGKVTEAEQYMQQQRDYLAQHGYYIRKLNQAYFAFYGTYADSPTSIDPIGDNMRQLRSKIDSLKGFIDNIAAMTSRQQLSDAADR